MRQAAEIRRDDRLIDPPRSAFGDLPNSLTDGELQVIDLFDRYLAPAWEMYVQPHLNGLRPDLVLLNPCVGVAVFEIKDWDLTAMHYYVPSSRLRARRDSKRFDIKNPIDKIRLYKTEIYDLYCPRLDAKAGQALAVITAGLVFTRTPRQQVVALLDPLRDDAMRKYPKYYPIAGSDDLMDPSLDQVFPESKRPSSNYMTPDMAKDLRGWLREPAFSQEGRYRPIGLSPPQRNLVTTRTRSGYRRLKGAAGSGKSVVVACRAAELARQDSSVLVVCYNITLLNYLRDLAVRHVVSARGIRQRVDFLNFHQWCKRICTMGDPQGYRQVWSEHFDSHAMEGDDPAPALDGVVTLVQELYRNGTPDLPTYNAILVDEGQDFHPRWWETLRQALKPGGEMMLVADRTQDIYGTSSNWTEAAMRGCGFSGRWSELNESYRLPTPVIPYVRQFATTFLKGELDLPTGVQTELAIDKCNLRWVHVESRESSEQACFNECVRMMKALPPNTAVADITFICSSRDLGRSVVGRLEDKHIRIRHTFSEDDRASRRQKRALFQGDARVKATTIHSYKGWEGKLLVVFIESVDSPRDKALLYTAMTRLRKDQQQSSLTVVSACRNLRDFGRDWPHYEEYYRAG